MVAVAIGVACVTMGTPRSFDIAAACEGDDALIDDASLPPSGNTSFNPSGTTSAGITSVCTCCKRFLSGSDVTDGDETGGDVTDSDVSCVEVSSMSVGRPTGLAPSEVDPVA